MKNKYKYKLGNLQSSIQNPTTFNNFLEENVIVQVYAWTKTLAAFENKNIFFVYYRIAELIVSKLLHRQTKKSLSIQWPFKKYSHFSSEKLARLVNYLLTKQRC